MDARAIRVLEQAYADATRLGFLGPKELDRLWERHLDDAFGLAAIRRAEPGDRWADLGAGAGLAAARGEPDGHGLGDHYY